MRRNHVIVTAIAALTALTALGCEGTASGVPTTDGCQATYPDAAGATLVLHVAASCDSEVPDGSAAQPYQTIGEAIEAATPGTTIVVESETYEENLVIAKENLTILGEVSTDGSELTGIVLQSPDPKASITVQGVAGVVLRGVHIIDPTVAGVWVVGGSATITDSSVSGAMANADGAFGFGVLSTNKAGIVLQNTAITGSEATGILLQNGEGLSSVTDSDVSGNGRGGIRFENMPDGSTIAGNTLNANMEVGIGIFSSVGIVLQNNGVHDTMKGGPKESADGIIVAELISAAGESFGPSEVMMGGDAGKADGHLGNTVTGSGRIGVLMSGDVSGIVLQNEVRENGRAGIWLQSGAGMGSTAGIVLQNNAVVDNHFLGISLAAGTSAEVTGNVVSGTRADVPEGTAVVVGPDLANVTMGDGIGVFAGATAIVIGNTISDNARAGILGDGLNVDTTTISGNSYNDNSTGSIVLQNVAPNALADETDGEVTTMGAGEALGTLKEANDMDGFGMGSEAGIVLQ